MTGEASPDATRAPDAPRESERTRSGVPAIQRNFPKKDPIDREGLRERFWERIPLSGLSKREWEALCDGCGKCCLHKFEDPDTAEVAYTRVACRLLDESTCRCAQYSNRKLFVSDCLTLSPRNIADNAYWLPETCAYRLLHEGRPLHEWHPLVSGDSESAHLAGATMRGRTVPEYEIPEEDWEEHMMEEPLR